MTSHWVSRWWPSYRLSRSWDSRANESFVFCQRT